MNSMTRTGNSEHTAGTQRRVYYLVAVLVLMWGLTAAGLTWWRFSDQRRSMIANDYHLTAADQSLLLRQQAKEILWLIGIEGGHVHEAGQLQGGRVGVDAPSAATGDLDHLSLSIGIQDKMHLMEQPLASLQLLHDQFASGPGNSLIRYLSDAYANLQSLMPSDQLVTRWNDEALGNWARELHLRADQLYRLHLAGYDSSIKEGEQARTRENWILAGLFLAMALIGGALVAAITRQIRQSDSQIRDSEARFRVLAESSVAGIWQADASFKTTYVNPSLRAMLGGADAGDLIGKPYTEFFAPESTGQITEFQAAETTNPTVEAELAAKTDDPRIVLASGGPSFAADGQLQGLVGTVVDITERKKAEQARKASQEQFLAVVNNSPMSFMLKDRIWTGSASMKTLSSERRPTRSIQKN
jgi:PAS domain S-box-containing protein